MTEKRDFTSGVRAESQQDNETTRERNERLDIKILIAEDEEPIQKLYLRILQAQGYQVEIVKDGAELLERLLNSKPGDFSVILTDNTMPGMKGIEVVRQINADERLAHLRRVPVILSTGDTGTGGAQLQQEIQSVGGFFLPKPIHWASLDQTILEVVRNSQA